MALEDEVWLVARILDGEHGALEQFISKYRSFIYAILTRHLNLPRDAADEVFQRFLIHIWEDDFRRLRAWSKTAPLPAFLGKMTRNLAADFRRERSRDSWIEDFDPTILDYRYLEADLTPVVQAALTELSDRDRELIHRRYFLGQTYREIAGDLGMSPNHAGVALHRAAFRLKQILTRSL
jgi:RNA polymerase sigma factor (sigma-70 family)